jgi:hypothetical protein
MASSLLIVRQQLIGRVLLAISPFLALAVLVTAACGAPPTAPREPTTFALSGTVTASAPSHTPLAGVTVTVVDGPTAGQSTTTDHNGRFALTAVKGPISLLASRDRYESATMTADLTGAESVRFTLKPLPVVLQLRLTPEMGATGPCDQPCRVYTFDVHNDGAIAASVTWNEFGFNLSVSLWRGGERIATSRRFNTLVNGFTEVPVSGGFTYQLRVTADERPLPNFELGLRRPN